MTVNMLLRRAFVLGVVLVLAIAALTSIAIVRWLAEGRLDRSWAYGKKGSTDRVVWEGLYSLRPVSPATCYFLLSKYKQVASLNVAHGRMALFIFYGENGVRGVGITANYDNMKEEWTAHRDIGRLHYTFFDGEGSVVKSFSAGGAVTIRNQDAVTSHGVSPRFAERSAEVFRLLSSFNPDWKTSSRVGLRAGADWDDDNSNLRSGTRQMDDRKESYRLYSQHHEDVDNLFRELEEVLPQADKVGNTQLGAKPR